jgi:hypothetical protein
MTSQAIPDSLAAHPLTRTRLEPAPGTVEIVLSDHLLQT